MIKFSILFAILISFSISEVSAQRVEGKVSISGFPNGRTLKEATAVGLFKSFKEGTYIFIFSYKSANVDEREMVIFFCENNSKV